MRSFRRPGSNVQAVQLTARALPAVRAELAARGIHHEIHDDGHMLLFGEHGPRVLPWGAWVAFDEAGDWDVYRDVVVEGWAPLDDPAGTPPGVSGSYGPRSRHDRVDDSPAVVDSQPSGGVA